MRGFRLLPSIAVRLSSGALCASLLACGGSEPFSPSEVDLAGRWEIREIIEGHNSTGPVTCTYRTSITLEPPAAGTAPDIRYTVMPRDSIHYTCTNGTSGAGPNGRFSDLAIAEVILNVQQTDQGVAFLRWFSTDTLLAGALSSPNQMGGTVRHIIPAQTWVATR